MFREITSELIKWKDNARRKPFLMLGVRQCGKTYIKLAFIIGFGVWKRTIKTRFQGCT